MEGRGGGYKGRTISFLPSPSYSCVMALQDGGDKRLQGVRVQAALLCVAEECEWNVHTTLVDSTKNGVPNIR